MQRFLQATVVTLVASVALLSAQSSAPTPSSTGLQHFYIFTQDISDASPFWFDYILDVKPSANGTIVQFIRIAPINAFCTRHITVKAVDRIVPASSVASVAQTRLCSLTESKVRSAIKAAEPEAIQSITEAASHTIVAVCGTKKRVFDLPYRESVDFDVLNKKSPAVAALWDLYPDVIHRVFGSNFSFYGVSGSQDEAFQELGSNLVPDIEAGLYDETFARNSLLSTMLRDDYIGTIPLQDEEEPAFVELADAPPVRFSKYVASFFPVLAKVARIQGDVRLRITIDVRTGSVSDVVALSGHPLLQQAAIDAARQWQFEQDGHLPESVESTMRFGLRCPSE